MSTLYLLEGTNTSLGASAIEDTVNLDMSSDSGDDTYTLRGSFPVTVPFDIPMDGLPTDLNSLILKKYQGMLSIYPGYSNILYDEQVDATGWDYTSSAGCTFGERQNNSITGNSATMQSSMATLTSAPTSYIFRWEAFLYGNSD